MPARRPREPSGLIFDPAFSRLVAEIHACAICAPHLPLGPRPIVRGRSSARLLIISRRRAGGCTTPGCRSTTAAVGSRSIARPSATRRGWLTHSALRLDARHVLVAEAEMVADLVDQHVANDAGQLLAGLAPIIEDRPAIEEHHVEIGPRIANALVR